MDEIADDNADSHGKLIYGPTERIPPKGHLIQPSRQGA
jgi:hypothetical protein